MSLTVYLLQSYNIKSFRTFFFFTSLLTNIYECSVACVLPPFSLIIILNLVHAHDLAFLFDIHMVLKDTNCMTWKHKKYLSLVIFVFIKTCLLFNPHPTFLIHAIDFNHSLPIISSTDIDALSSSSVPHAISSPDHSNNHSLPANTPTNPQKFTLSSQKVKKPRK